MRCPDWTVATHQQNADILWSQVSRNVACGLDDIRIFSSRVGGRQSLSRWVMRAKVEPFAWTPCGCVKGFEVGLLLKSTILELLYIP